MRFEGILAEACIELVKRADVREEVPEKVKSIWLKAYNSGRCKKGEFLEVRDFLAKDVVPNLEGEFVVAGERALDLFNSRIEEAERELPSRSRF